MGRAGIGVAELICCWCGERTDAEYKSECFPPDGHGEKSPERERVPETTYQLPYGWEVARPKL